MSPRAALIGTGRIARQHLACLAALPEAELVGVCDLSRAAAERAAERWGIPAAFTDHAEMLAAVRPDVVHVTTPPGPHLRLATDALEAGAHVVVEKPLASDPEQVASLLATARRTGRHLIEDYNYVHNAPVRRIADLLAAGEAGEVVHVEVTLCLDILSPAAGFTDPNLRNPMLDLAGGALADFLPHLASLAHAFVGPHRSVHSVWRKLDRSSPLSADELVALVDGERGTAALTFSAHAQPDLFSVRVHTTTLRATAGLFEPRLVVERLRPAPRPLVPVLNGLAEGRTAAVGALSGLAGKLSGGPGAYEGLWALLGETYRALATGAPPPVSLEQVEAVNALVADLAAQGPRS